MSEHKFLKEATLNLSASTEGQLLVARKIYDTLIDEVDKTLLPRELAAFVAGPDAVPGSSLDIDLVTVDSGTVRLVPESAQIPLDNAEYTSVNVKPDKYGVTIKITRELMEDGKFNLLQHNLRYFGRKFAENETNLIIDQALEQATNTTAGGAAITLANISTAVQNMQGNDFRQTDMIIGVNVAHDLRQIASFVQADQSGSDALLRREIYGTLYGMRIWMCTTSSMTATTAYVIDRTQAFCIVEKRPVTIEAFDLPQNDMQGVAMTQRVRARHLRALAIEKITTS